jgi:hypothetical protein
VSERAIPKRRIRGWRALADRLGCSTVTAWRSVGAGIVPPPAYVSERTPTWDDDEVEAALVRRTMKPNEAKAVFRAEKLARPPREAVPPEPPAIRPEPEPRHDSSVVRVRARRGLVDTDVNLQTGGPDGQKPVSWRQDRRSRFVRPS